MKKNLLIGLCLSTVFAVAANASSCQITSGAYAGLSLGASTLTGKNEFKDSNDAGAGPQITQNKLNSSLSKTSIAAGVFSGYGMKFGSFWAAAEAFYQFDRLKNKEALILGVTGLGNKLESASTGTYGAAAHLGFVPNNNCVVYAILGLDVRSFKVKFADSDTAAPISAKINKGYRSVAFAPGLGVRFSLCKNISVRTEYKYAMHRSKNFTSSGKNTAVPGQTDIVNIKHQPKIHSFNVGLVYSF